MGCSVSGLKGSTREKAKRKASTRTHISREKAADFPAEPLKQCCDNCGERIYIPAMKQLWSQDEVCMCRFEAKLVFGWTEVEKLNKQH